MTGRRVTRASSVAANSDAAQAAPSASAPKTPGGRSRKAGSTVARQSVVSKTTDTYGSKGADQYIGQNTAGKSKGDVATDFPDTASAHGSMSGEDRARSNPARSIRAARSDQGDVGLNIGNGNMTVQDSTANVENATVLNPFPDVTLRHTDTEGESHTSFHPNLKAWIGAFIAVLLVIGFTIYPPSFGGSKLVSVSTNTSSNDIALIQRLDHLESQISDLNKLIPDIHQVSVAEQYQVDYFDPRIGAMTWPKYTSPEKMRKVGGWMGFFKKEVPFSEVPKIVGPFPNVRKMWCAPSVHGKAQVTVLLPGTMIPKLLVIEQGQTKAQSLDGLPTYPKGVELYARRLHNAVPLPQDKEIVVPDGHDDQGRPLAPEQTLPDGFELVGLWRYDEEGPAKQSFIPQKNIVTSTVAVRVVSNWGDAEQICLHSLQLFGEKVDI